MLQLKDIRWSTETGESILNGVNLTVPDGKLTVITGPNGGGKTSLAKVIAGLYKPEGGQIIADGKDITDWSITDRSKNGLAYAFQQPVRFKGLTVRDLLSISAGKELSSAEVCHLLATVGLCGRDYIDREADASLSGGESKRIEIATVLARKDAKILVFDEPEAGIDLWSFEKLVDILSGLSNTAIVISHQEKLLQAANEIILLKKGKIAERGKAKDILRKLEGGKNES